MLWQTSLQKALVRWSPAKSQWWPGSGFGWSVTFSLQSRLRFSDAVLWQRGPSWHRCLYLQRSRAKAVKAVEQIILFLMLLRSPAFVKGNGLGWKIKKSVNEARITSTFPGKNATGRTLRKALPDVVKRTRSFWRDCGESRAEDVLKAKPGFDLKTPFASCPLAAVFIFYYYYYGSLLDFSVFFFSFPWP